MEKPTVLSQSTLLPVSIVGVLFGAAMWLTTIYVQGQENTKQIVEIKEQRKDDMDYIRHDLKEIQKELKEINSKLDKRI
jgi:hypothetical protein